MKAWDLCLDCVRLSYWVLYRLSLWQQAYCQVLLSEGIKGIATPTQQCAAFNIMNIYSFTVQLMEKQLWVLSSVKITNGEEVLAFF